MDGVENVQTGNRQLKFAPAPSPYDELFDPFATQRPDLARSGIEQWLLDFGHDLTGSVEVWTLRAINKVIAEDGLQVASNLAFSFDPEFEHATVHTVRVWRNGVPREVGRPEAFQLLQREPNLERAHIDGSLTASLVIPDVRVGDVIETCYSIAGGNPALRGAFSAIYALQWGHPAARRRYRLTTAKDRQIAVRTKGRAPVYQEEDIDHALERSWILVDVAAYQPEPDTPSWWVGFSQIAVADEMTWAQVADVHRSYYVLPSVLPAELQTEVARIAAETSDPRERARLALGLVQSSVRYHAIAVGVGGYVPREIDEIWSTRFGDCKDTSRLFVALARALDLDAHPALVSAGSGPDLIDLPPSARAFNHCIVMLTIDGEVFWLDPTRGPQGGRLEHLVQFRQGYALPLMPNAELFDMGEYPAQKLMDVSEVWTFGPTARSSAEVTMISKYGSWRADELRRVLANDGGDVVAKRLSTGFERQYSQLETVEKTTFVDDLDANVITVAEHYRVERPFRPIERELTAAFVAADELVGPYLTVQETSDRTAPIDLGTPRQARWRREYNFGFPMPPAEWARDWTGPGVHYRHKCETLTPKHQVQELNIEFTKSWVPASDAKALYDFCRKARSSTNYIQTVGIDAADALNPAYHPPTKRQDGFVTAANVGRFAVAAIPLLFALSQCAGGH